MLPAASPGCRLRRGPSEDALPSGKRSRDLEDSSTGSDSDSPSSSGSGSDTDGDFVSDLREIVCLLRLIKGGANKDGQKMCEQIIASVAADIQSMLEDTKLKFEKERQNLLKVLSNTSKECESSLSEECTKLQETYEMFCQEKDAHLQTFRDLFSQVEVEKKKLLEQYEQHRTQKTATLSEFGNTFPEKITNAEPSPRRMKQGDKSFIIFRKTIGSFLECGSDDDFDLDNE
ncbi:uncharacterized protein LOC100827237 isoform X2 [Brachypodium distachyon]|uniref:Uncharacterized protein n=1 Tax=Brachypodium distachyon TaxID=15368 RepID=A0A2K2DR73_BRADI|nr:uncharacterized protein LOC100827237 isoform X2 [Brachypodium distachyon]PNT76770.1 hypothetical protein BRADI_1g53182v3 [Brachypodium distachyon]|eukprot:XP_024313189.1 uncharacterized protein LOC100827237 isoform X2 [Brachypodium distachyon]